MAVPTPIKSDIKSLKQNLKGAKEVLIWATFGPAGVAGYVKVTKSTVRDVLRLYDNGAPVEFHLEWKNGQGNPDPDYMKLYIGRL